MTRRIWIIVTAVILAVGAIGGVAAFAGGGAADDQDASPSLGIPAPWHEGIDETEVVDGSGLDVEILPKYDGSVDGPPPITEGPVEEPVSSMEGGAVINGELADDESGLIVGDGPLTMGMPAPGFEDLVDEMVVVPAPPDSLVVGTDTP